MKKVAFFIALIVGLNATAVVRKPEEEEGQSIVLKDEDNKQNKNRTSVIHHITQSILTCFYAVTKDGKLEAISWDRIAKIFNHQKTGNQKLTKSLTENKFNWFLMNYQADEEKESVSYNLLQKK